MMIEENTFFKEATLRICGSLDIERALRDCFNYIKVFIPVEQLSFHIYHRDPAIVETVAVAPYDGVLDRPFKSQLSERGRKQVDVQRSRRVRRIVRLGDDPVTGPVATKLGMPDHSGVVMDLVLEREMLGVFCIFYKREEKLESNHVHLLSLLQKPCAIALTNHIRYRDLEILKDLIADDNRYLQKELSLLAGENLIGGNKGLKDVMQLIRYVAPIDSPVLLLGETGTGKEMIANAIHRLSLRSEGPFIKVNCGAIPSTLIDSELFGYEKGAFTGATKRKRGRIERANGGTLFLDEIGELTPEAQIRLLRVLQEKEIDRIGGNQTIHVSIRIIAATHRDLEKMMAQNRFRADLYFRLSVFPIDIPPLRQRKGDIEDLVHHFIEKKCREMKRLKVPSVAPEEIRKLESYHWPGNIRELENAVERSLILNPSLHLNFEDIQNALNLKPEVSVYATEEISPLDEAMKKHIQLALNYCRGRVEGEKGAARLLQINPSTLRKRMTKLKIPFGRRQLN